MINGTPNVKVLQRLVISKQTISRDAMLKETFDSYAKKTAAFGKLLKEVKDASKALKDVVIPRLKDHGIDADMDVRVTADEGTVVVEVLQREKKVTRRNSIPETTL